MGRMDEQHPNRNLINGVVEQLSDTKTLVWQLHLKGNEHLCCVRTIFNEKKASFSVVMTEMRRHAISVIDNVLAIEIALLRVIENVLLLCH